MQAYPEDLESSFPTEAIHFSELLKTEQLEKKKTGIEKVAMELNIVSSHNRKCLGGLLSEHGDCTTYVSSNDGKLY